MSDTSVITRDPQVLGGAPVFRGTRVPVRTLVDYLRAGQRLDDFLDDFPSVTRDHAVAVFDLVLQTMLALPYEHTPG
jgi:uncharacterized protein (DUF433 family)